MSRRSAILIACLTAIIAASWFFIIRESRETTSASLPRFASYFMQPSFVDDAFTSVGPVAMRTDVSMVLVNHHLLASHLIARMLAMVATDEPIVVVLVAPDHFTQGSAPITSVVADWATPYGALLPATDALKQLDSSMVVHLQERPFATEHGITNITMFIKKALPNAKLVPIIIRDDAKAQRIDELAQAISQLSGRVLTIGSFDFTHDATDAIARASDAQSIQLLKQGDPDNAQKIVIDSKPGIRLLLKLAQLRGLAFSLGEQSSSAQLLHDFTRTDVTSYITGTWAQSSGVVH